MTFKNILCPVDFSENNEKVLSLALKLSEDDSTINLFHHSVLVTPAQIQPMEMAMTFEADKELLDIAKKDLDTIAEKLKTQYPNRNFKTYHSYAKGLIDEINDIIKENNIDLVVIGTHGRTGLKRLLLGSIAEDILRHASCPVFMVKI